MISDVAPRFENCLFLSATPHNGHSKSFSALLELLDPQRFHRGVPVRPAQRNRVMVRRLKSEAKISAAKVAVFNFDWLAHGNPGPKALEKAADDYLRRGQQQVDCLVQWRPVHRQQRLRTGHAAIDVGQKSGCLPVAT